MELLKSTVSKVVTGVIAVAVIGAGIMWWQTPQETREAILQAISRILAWIGIVVVTPWAGALLVAWVARRDSNASGIALVVGLTVVEAVLLAWLLQWKIAGSAEWIFYALGILVAGAYNLLICDWLAERVK